MKTILFSFRTFLVGMFIFFIISLACAAPLKLVSPTQSPERQSEQQATLLPDKTEIFDKPDATQTPEPDISATALPRYQGVFRYIPAAEGNPETIHDIWVSPSGQVWLAGSEGVYQINNDRWILLFRQPVDQILGDDGNGKTWFLLGQGEEIASFDGSAWVIYNLEQGWAPLEKDVYLSPGIGDNLVVDSVGNTWLATGQNSLRVFNPKTNQWNSISAKDIGYQPPSDLDYREHFLTNVLKPRKSEIWVSDCIGQGESLSGQGIRKFDGNKWAQISDLADQCIYDMKMDRNGHVWAGGFDTLFEYDPQADKWKNYPLPKWERKQLVSEIEIDPLNRPWIQVWRGGGASLWGASARYHLENGVMATDLDLDKWSPGTIAFAPGAVTYLCTEGTVYQLSGGKSKKIGSLDTLDCKIGVDMNGNLWVAALEGPDKGLWKLNQ